MITNTEIVNAIYMWQTIQRTVCSEAGRDHRVRALQEVKHGATIRCISFAPRDTPKRTEIKDLNMCLHTNVHSRVIHNCEQVEIT